MNILHGLQVLESHLNESPMRKKIAEILLPERVSSAYRSTSPNNSLTDVKRLNAFVGPNNSGKSRLLRALFAEGAKLKVSIDHDGVLKIRNCIRWLAAKVDAAPAGINVRNDLHNLLQNPTGFQGLVSVLMFENELTNRIGQLQNQLSSDTENNLRATASRNYEELGEFRRHLYELRTGIEGVNNHLRYQTDGGYFQSVHPDARFVYIPTLRGLRSPSLREDEVNGYFDRTWKDYFNDNTFPGLGLADARNKLAEDTIRTGLELYSLLTRKLLGDRTDRESIAKFETYLSEAFFGGIQVSLIPRMGSDSVYIRIGNEEHPVEHLGDGLQHLIIMTLPLYEHRDKPLFLFIEEPDLFLHAGYQRRLIEKFIGDSDRELYVFVTTHSSQFLDITIPDGHCSVYRFERRSEDTNDSQGEQHFRVTRSGIGDGRLLEDVGVTPSSVLLANCTIWVEGVTDRKYFRKCIQLYFEKHREKKDYIEGLHYSFVEYGGSNITHWSFLDDEGIDVERLCAKLILIADKDTGKSKEKRHKELRRNLGERFICLSVQEVENLLTAEVVRKVVSGWIGNGMELPESIFDGHENHKLGEFIEERLRLNKATKGAKKKKFASKSGSIERKQEFCDRALEHIVGFSDLSRQAVGVTKKICDFIIASNSY